MSGVTNDPSLVARVDGPPMADGTTPVEIIQKALPSSPSELSFRGYSAKLHKKISYTSLQELEAMGGQPRSTMKSVLVCMILYYKKVITDSKKGLFNRVSQSKVEGQNYDKTLTVMDLRSPPGRNSAIILLNADRADIVFGQFIEGRDSMEGFGPGSIVVISRPNPIDNFFGSDSQRGMPVLSFSGGFKLIDMKAMDSIKASLDMIPFKETSSRLHGFYYPRVKIIPTNMNVGHSPCCGYLCDSIGLKKTDGSNNWHRSCPCYVTKNTLGQVILDMNLRFLVVDDDGKPTGAEFVTENFTSRRFTHMFTVAGIPPSVTASMLEQQGVDFDIYLKVEELIEYVNNHCGGFHVIGWARRGIVKDSSALAENGSRSGEAPKVISGTVTYHVTHIGMNKDSTSIGDRLVNVAQMLFKKD